MFIQLTRTDGTPVWLNSCFVVTVEPARGGGSVVVPIGDGLDYDVRESPETVLSMLEGAPPVTVVPVPPPKALTPRPDDVSPDAVPAVEAGSGHEPRKTTRKTAKSAAKKKADGADDGTQVPKAAESEVPQKKKRVPAVKKRIDGQTLTEEFSRIADDLRARKCRTVKRMRNAMKSFHGKTDAAEIDGIIGGMADAGHIVIEADGHVNWTTRAV